MTLVPFPPQKLDDLSLRLLDIAVSLRKMATLAREHALQGFHLHGNKADEWLDRLEDWAIDGMTRIEAEVMRERGARRGRTRSRARNAPPSRRPSKQAKKVR